MARPIPVNHSMNAPLQVVDGESLYTSVLASGHFLVHKLKKTRKTLFIVIINIHLLTSWYLILNNSLAQCTMYVMFPSEVGMCGLG